MKSINIFRFGCVFLLALFLICPVGVKAATWLDVSLDVIPSTCGPATLVNIQGTANIDGDAGTPAKGADVFINVTNTESYLDEHSTTTDATGHYSISITAPSIPGTYTVNITSIMGTLTGWNDTPLEILTPRPDLTIVDGIVLPDDALKEGDKVPMSCNVTNAGKVLAEANVTFYDGDPTLKGIEFYCQNITLAADDDIIISTTWTALVGPHTIYVVIENCTPEDSNTSNDQASIQLEAADITLPLIHNVSISPANPTSDDNITISVLATDNYGLAKQNAVLVNYTIDNGTEQSLNATLLSSDLYQTSIGIYPANTQIEFKVAVQDQYGNINTSSQYLIVTSYSFIDIQLDPFFQGYEQDAAMWINGIAMLDGLHPVILGDIFVSTDSRTDIWTTITDEEGAFSVQILTPLTGGEHTLDVSVIGSIIDSTIQATFTVFGDAPDLQISSNDIELSPTLPVQGDIVQISVTAHNIGKVNCQANISIYLGDPANNGTLISHSNVFIMAGSTNTNSYAWYVESEGILEIWVVLESDGAERVLANNAISRSIYVSQPESQNLELESSLIGLNIFLATIVVVLVLRLQRNSNNSSNKEKKESESIDE